MEMRALVEGTLAPGELSQEHAPPGPMMLYLSWLGDLKHPVHLLLTAASTDLLGTHHTTQASHGGTQRRYLMLRDSAQALLGIFSFLT